MSAVDDFLAYDQEQGIEKNAGLFGAARRVLTADPVAVAAEGAAAGRGAAGSPFRNLLWDTMKGTAAVATAGAATGLALGGAEKLWDLASNTVSRVHGFNTMMKANPELDKMDRQKVHTVYSTLHRFNPEMAKDPFVSGAWVKKLTEYDYVDPKTVGDLIAARSRAPGGDYLARGVSLAQTGAQFGALDYARTRAQEQAKLDFQQKHQGALLQDVAARAGAQRMGALAAESMEETGPAWAEAEKRRMSPEALEAARRISMAQAEGKTQHGMTPEAGRALGMQEAEKERGRLGLVREEQAMRDMAEKARLQAAGQAAFAGSPKGLDLAFNRSFTEAAGRGAYESE